mmetsp:Transcript_12527/g.20785  ORF Transcript_12527/g.20785 Transcript_12527/m.20785 type:complete len:326 (-) Transcript_12527:1519-2496(-)
MKSVRTPQQTAPGSRPMSPIHTPPSERRKTMKPNGVRDSPRFGSRKFREKQAMEVTKDSDIVIEGRYGSSSVLPVTKLEIDPKNAFNLARTNKNDNNSALNSKLLDSIVQQEVFGEKKEEMTTLSGTQPGVDFSTDFVPSVIIPFFLDISRKSVEVTVEETKVYPKIADIIIPRTSKNAYSEYDDKVAQSSIANSNRRKIKFKNDCVDDSIGKCSGKSKGDSRRIGFGPDTYIPESNSMEEKFRRRAYTTIFKMRILFYLGTFIIVIASLSLLIAAFIQLMQSTSDAESYSDTLDQEMRTYSPATDAGLWILTITNFLVQLYTIR